MLVDHDRAGELLEQLRGLTDGYRPPTTPAPATRRCTPPWRSLEADTHLHVHKENNVLFPAVLELATEAPEVDR